MTTATHIDGLAQTLLGGEAQPHDWRRFEGLPTAEREAVVDRLKADVDRLVRSTPPLALEAAEVLLRAAELVPSRRPLGLRGHAAALHMNGRSDEALADYEAAVRLYADLGDEGERARVLRSMVDVLHRAGHIERALEVGAEARRIFEERGEERLIAQVDVNLGNVHVRRGELLMAGECYAGARERFERCGDDVGRAFATFSLANLERDAGRLAEAERLYHEARAAWEAAGLDAHVADCDSSLAALDARQGRYGAAILALESARRLYAQHSRPTGVPECDLELAEIHFRLDAWHDALDCARRAAQGFDASDYGLEVGRALLLSGLSREHLGDHAGALADLDRAERHFEAFGNRPRLAALSIHRAGLLAGHGQVDLALRIVERARTELRRERHHFLADLAEVARMRALAAAGRDGEALAVMETLVARESHSPLDVLVGIEARRTGAAIHRHRGHPVAEREALQGAIAAVEAGYSEVLGADARIAFFRGRHALYEDLAWNHLEAGEPLDGLRVLEAARGRSRRESQRRAATGEARAIRERLDWLLSRRLDVELVGGADDGPTDRELAECERDLLRIERASGRTLGGPAGEVRVELLLDERSPGETLVFYLVTARGAVALVADDGGLRQIPLSATSGAIDVLRDRLRLQIHKFRLGSDYLQRQELRLRRSLDSILSELGDLLVRPIKGYVGNGPLVVFPYGALHGLPFHAMLVDSAPLVAGHEVSYAPSLALFAEARGRRGRAARSVLVCGTSDARAPRIVHEAEAACVSFAGRVERLEPTALRERLAGSCEASLLHVGAHGSFRADHPLFSGLDLGGAFLTAYDLRSMRIDVDLVVLSGCETGRQVRFAGEELVGIERALFDAGVRAVVGSLWPVLDDATAALMARFYGHLAAGDGARTALSKAQREALAAGATVGEWAAFAVVGDGSVHCPR